MNKSQLNTYNSNKFRCVIATFKVVSIMVFMIVSIYPSYSFAKQSSKYAAFVMDADTGLILYRDNADKILHPASLTKMMTLLMTFEALESGKLKLNDRIKISRHAANMVPSKLGLKPGSTIKVKDAIYSLVTKSANDVAVAIAEKLGKTEKGFALMMTKKARSLGMKRTVFKNASGLHNPKQVSTARDMARLSRAMVNDYRPYYHYFSTKKFTYQGKTYRSHNRLMDTYKGMDGLKTGYIQASGFNLASSAIRDGRRLVAVVFGGKTSKSRNAQMKKLLDKSFNKIKNLRVASYKAPVPERKPRLKINGDNIKISSSNKVNVFTPAPKYPKKRRSINLGYNDKKLSKTSRWAMLDPSSSGLINTLIGEGDFDINIRNRIETGLIAISAHLREDIPPHALNAPPSKALKLGKINYNQPAKTTSRSGSWSIQIGAFTSRERANKAISTNIARLPDNLRHGKVTIAPRQTKQGWIFRSRLHGYTKASANKACGLLDDCIALSPNAI